MSSNLFAIIVALIALLVGLATAQSDSIPAEYADGIENAQVVEPRISMLRFLRQNPLNIGNLNVSTLLIRINDGNSEGSGSDADLGSRSFRATFFVPSDSAWEQFARRLYAEGEQVPDLSSPNAIARAVAERFTEIRDRFQDVESLYRTVRYHIVPGAEYYMENSTDNTLPTLSGFELTHDDDGTLYDFMDESATVTGAKYLLSNGWIIPIEKVLIPFNITALLGRVQASPSADISPTVTPTPMVLASASSSAEPEAVSPSASLPPGAVASSTPSTSLSSALGTSPEVTMSEMVTTSDEPGGVGETDDESPEPSGGGNDGDGDGDGDGVCFPASSRVHLSGGSQLEMRRLEAGMFVMHSETGESSRVFLFTHRDESRLATFKKLSTACGESVKLTPNHYLYVNGKLAAAGTVAVGDNLRTVNGACAVTEVATVHEMGLFAPHTMHGDLIVDGVVVSGYSRAVHPDVAHALLAPIRWLTGISGVKEPLGGVFYKGADWALKLVPRGKDRYD